jgi:hypothetical protein
VPPFPPGTRWVGGEPAAVERVCARGPLLVHFLDFAQLNSVRALPYLRAWQERYEALGLTILGVNSPRYPFTAGPAALASGLARLEVAHPVASDASYEIWRAYGCQVWPSLFLWGQGGALRWYHFGEGEYRSTEAAIQAELRAAGVDGDLPEPLEPLRPSDAPGALVAAPSEEVFPGGSADEPWTGEASGAPLELGYEAAGAFASLDGDGTLQVSLDGGGPRAIAINAPGLYPLAEHPAHERHRIALRPSPGVRVWSVSFAAGVPGPAAR